MSLVFIDSLSISGMEGGLAGETGVGEKVELRVIMSQCLRGKEEGRRMDVALLSCAWFLLFGFCDMRLFVGVYAFWLHFLLSEESGVPPQK
jgi:hypothetical protein